MTLIAPDSLVDIAKTESSGSDGEVGFQLTTTDATIEGDFLLYLCLASGAVNGGISASNVKAGGITGQVGSQRTHIAPAASTTYSHTNFSPTGLFTGLASGTYTFYLAAEDDGVPLLELYTHQFTIEAAAASGGEVEIVATGGASVASHQASFSLLTETNLEGDEAGEDAAIIVLAGQPEEYGLTCTFNGVSVPLIGGSGNYQVFRLQEPPIGNHTLLVRDAGEDAQDVTVIAVSVKNVDTIRTLQISGANLTSAGATNAEVNDLVLAFGGRLNGTNLTIGSPFTRLDFRGGSGRASIAVAEATSESNGQPSGGAWTATGGSGAMSGGIALVPLAAPVPEEEAPVGDVLFDVAVGHDAVVPRNVVYDGEDDAETTTGFKFQYRIGSGSAVDYEPDTAITGLTEGQTITLSMRAVNDEGDGPWSDDQTFRVHYDWHRPGLSIGNHVSLGWDTVSTPAFQGPLTTSGRERAILAAFDIGYGTIGTHTAADTVPHDVTYDGVLADRVLQALAYGSNPRNGVGGSEMHLLAGVPLGTHTLRYESVADPNDRSLWMSAVAIRNVDQDQPLATTKYGMWSDVQTEIVTPLPMVSGIITLPSIPISMDEMLFVMAGCYGYAEPGGDIPLSGEYEGWSSGHNGPGTGINNAVPQGSEWTKFSGSGAGPEDSIGHAYLNDPSAAPLIDSAWRYTDHHWTTLGAVAVRPSPNMLHTLSIGERDETGFEWTCQSDCNHGRVLIALTPASDTAPTAQQIRDEIDATAVAEAYSGTFVETDTLDLTTTGSNGDTLAATITPETDYRLSVVYESWQGNLGDPLVQTFNLVADPPTLTAIKTYPNAVFPIHDGNSTTEARINNGEPVLVGENGGIGGLTADTTYDAPGLQLREFGGEWGEPAPFSTREAVGPITVRIETEE